MKHSMKLKLFLLVVLMAAVFLGATAQAEIRVNEFPEIDAIPEHFVAADELPPLPTYKVRGEPQGSMSRYTVTGVKAWGVDPEMMADLRYSFEKGWYSTSSNRYDDQIVFILDLKPGDGMLFPAVETEDGPVNIYLTIMKDYNSDSPSSGLIETEFRFKADGTSMRLRTDGELWIKREYENGHLNVWYDESGNIMFSEEVIATPDGFGRLGAYTLERVTDCLTGERFEELTVEGGLDPDATRLRIAGEELPRKIKILPPGKTAFGEGDPVLPVRDTLPADALPEVWPAEFPDAFPAFSCEEADGKYIWTVESLNAWGARPNIPGETYLVREAPGSIYSINYYTRDRTFDDVPDDRFRIISEDRDGAFRVNVYTVENDAWITLEGEAKADSEGNPAPTLSLTLEFKYPTRRAFVKYFSDGTTVQKQITAEIGGEKVTGEYGEDNRLR